MLSHDTVMLKAPVESCVSPGSVCDHAAPLEFSNTILYEPFTATLSEPEGKRILSFWAEMYKFLVEEQSSIKS